MGIERADQRRADAASTTRKTSAPSSTPDAHGRILGLQSAAGNRAVGAYVQRLAADVQRDDDPPVEAADPLQQAPPDVAKFSDTVNVSTTDVPITVRNNAFDLVSGLQARFGGGDGGQTSVAPMRLTTELDANRRVTGAQVVWDVSVLVPVVRADPNGPISKPEAAAELDACNRLVARIREHELQHAAIEVKTRTGFAKTLQGKPDSSVDTALKGLKRAVGRKQRALDNIEGLITLNSANVVVTSGKDHPEYEADD